MGDKKISLKKLEEQSEILGISVDELIHNYEKKGYKVSAGKKGIDIGRCLIPAKKSEMADGIYVVKDGKLYSLPTTAELTDGTIIAISIKAKKVSGPATDTAGGTPPGKDKKKENSKDDDKEDDEEDDDNNDE